MYLRSHSWYRQTEVRFTPNAKQEGGGPRSFKHSVLTPELGPSTKEDQGAHTPIH